MLVVVFLIFTILGCGSNTKASKENDNIQKEQEIKQEQEQEKYNDEENKIYKHYRSDDIVIVNSSLSYAPNIDLYDSDPSGAYFSYEYDSQKGYALTLHSNGMQNAFHILGYDAQERYLWEELPTYQNRRLVSWDGKFSNDFIIFIVLKFTTSDGEMKWKDLIYTPSSHGYNSDTNNFLHISLGSSAKDGNWHHYTRDILSDLRRFYPGANINYDDGKSGYINGFAVRGSGKITNIVLSYDD
jgi:hypothetical protein